MPQVAKQYVDVPMTNFSLELKNFNFLADTLFPVIPVKLRTGIYYEYGQEDLMADGTDVRAPGASAGTIDYSLIQHTYGPLMDHSLKMKIPVENQENVMDPLDPFRDATRKLTAKAKLYKELDAALKLTNSGIITQNVAPTNKWNDYISGSQLSHPINDLTTAFDTLAAGIQKPRNLLTVVLSYPVFSALINHPDVIERFKYSQAAIITADMLRDLFQVREVLVGYGVKNGAAEGASASMSYVWGKHCWVMYREDSPQLQTVSGAYTLNMPQIFGPWVMKRWFDTDKESDFMRISYYYQQFIMAPQAIYWFNGAIS